MPVSDRAEMYAALAEALAEPSQWLCQAGREWPLYPLAERLLPNSSALPMMALVEAEELAGRQARYAALVGGQPRTWLSEAAFLTGRILGEATFAVAKCYAQAGLQVEGSELPDSAMFELAFLGQLVEGDPAAARSFLKNHASVWLPGLGQTLANGSDGVYAAVGQVLVDWIAFELNPEPKKAAAAGSSAARLPVLADAPACTLCGFCAQRCPTGALTVRETANQTALVLAAARCTGCSRCAKVCDAGLISMVAGVAGPESVALRTSERVACRKCGEPIVSRAELDFVVRQIGPQDWLEYCSACRAPGC